ncbi:unnamed protein product, partial [Lymnaea stagnalis]
MDIKKIFQVFQKSNSSHSLTKQTARMFLQLFVPLLLAGAVTAKPVESEEQDAVISLPIKWGEIIERRGLQDIDLLKLLEEAVKVTTVGKKDLVQDSWQSVLQDIVTIGATVAPFLIGKKEITVEDIDWNQLLGDAVTVATTAIKIFGKKDLDQESWQSVLQDIVTIGATVAPFLIGKKEITVEDIDWNQLLGDAVTVATTAIKIFGKKDLDQESWQSVLQDIVTIGATVAPFIIGKKEIAVEDIDWNQLLGDAVTVATTAIKIFGKKDLDQESWQSVLQDIVTIGATVAPFLIGKKEITVEDIDWNQLLGDAVTVATTAIKIFGKKDLDQ